MSRYVTHCMGSRLEHVTRFAYDFHPTEVSKLLGLLHTVDPLQNVTSQGFLLNFIYKKILKLIIYVNHHNKTKINLSAKL